jgi:GGDEF domain-containing protein
VTAAVRQVGVVLGTDYKLTVAKIKPTDESNTATSAHAPVVASPDDPAVFAHPVRAGNDIIATLHLATPPVAPVDEARHFLAGLAHQLGKLAALQERHAQLQRLAITDDLTGLYNGRYFRHFLSKILDKAKALRFPVTLLLFDIDNFKKYNDQYGHAVGDEILRETATLMKRCVREHDCVARISGDEFAVVFWEKEGPRMAHAGGGVPGRPPQTPLQVFTRFRGLLNSQEFKGLGASGQGVLTISGGLAVYPYDATTADDLYNAADRALMFGSKKAGKNTVFLVGSDEPMRHNPPTDDSTEMDDGL